MKELWFKIEGGEEQLRRREKKRQTPRPGLWLLLGVAALALVYSQRGTMVTLTPLALDFGTVLDHDARDQAVEVANMGEAALNLRNASLSGPNATDFSVLSNPCPPHLMAGEHCYVTVRFLPTAVAPTPTSRIASLDISSETSDYRQHVSLKGTGVPRVDLAISPGRVDFQDQEAGTASGPKQVEIRNKGDFPLALRAIELTDDTNSEFLLDRGDCNNTPLKPNGACTFSVSFSPRSARPAVTATVTITDESGDTPHQVSLKGNGLPPGASHLAIDPGSIDFGNLNLNVESPAWQITVTSAGTKDLHIGQISIDGPRKGDFRIVDDGCSNNVFSPGARCTVSVSFRPLVTQGSSAALNIPDDAGDDPHSVSLIGTGVIPARAQLDVSPPNWSFGTVELRKVSDPPLRVILSSTGNAPVTVAGISFTGGNPTDFISKQDCLKQLSPRDTCVVLVYFRPLAAGIRRATLNINEANSTSHTVDLDGTGKNPGYAAATIDPPVLTFAPDQTGNAQTIAVKSVGTAELDIGTIGVDQPKYFSIARTNCNGARLQPSATCVIAVIYQGPRRLPAQLTSTLVVPYTNDNARTNPDRVVLRATAVAPPPRISFDVQPRELSFNKTISFLRSYRPPVNQQTVQPVWVTNNGADPIALSQPAFSPGGAFGAQAKCDLSRLEPRTPCEVPVVFSATSGGEYQSTMEIGPPGGTPILVALRGVVMQPKEPPPPPPPTVTGWCCVQGNLRNATPEVCKNAGGYYSPTPPAGKCSNRVVQIHQGFEPNIRQIEKKYVPPPQPAPIK